MAHCGGGIKGTRGGRVKSYIAETNIIITSEARNSHYMRSGGREILGKTEYEAEILCKSMHAAVEAWF